MENVLNLVIVLFLILFVLLVQTNNALPVNQVILLIHKNVLLA